MRVFLILGSRCCRGLSLRAFPFEPLPEISKHFDEVPSNCAQYDENEWQEPNHYHFLVEDSSILVVSRIIDELLVTYVVVSLVNLYSSGE